jgi:hypothetical protein
LITVPSPPAGRDSIDDRSAARPSPRAWGKFKRHFWGRSLRHQQAGDLGVEIYLLPPEQPYADQERLGVRHYRLSANARKQARAIGIRGGDLEVRIARMVRHAAPFVDTAGNISFQGILMRVEDDTVTWIGPAIPPRRRKRSTRRKASGRKAK